MLATPRDIDYQTRGNQLHPSISAAHPQASGDSHSPSRYRPCGASEDSGEQSHICCPDGSMSPAGNVPCQAPTSFATEVLNELGPRPGAPKCLQPGNGLTMETKVVEWPSASGSGTQRGDLLSTLNKPLQDTYLYGGQIVRSSDINFDMSDWYTPSLSSGQSDCGQSLASSTNLELSSPPTTDEIEAIGWADWHNGWALQRNEINGLPNPVDLRLYTCTGNNPLETPPQASFLSFYDTWADVAYEREQIDPLLHWMSEPWVRTDSGGNEYGDHGFLRGLPSYTVSPNNSHTMPSIVSLPGEQIGAPPCHAPIATSETQVPFQFESIDGRDLWIDNHQDKWQEMPNARNEERLKRNRPLDFITDGGSKNRRTREDELIVEGKRQGKTYKQIREELNLTAAESTLRGRFRALTKEKKDRVRKPEWTEKDVRLLKNAVTEGLTKFRSMGSHRGRNRIAKVSWKAVADYIAAHGGTYHFGNATCKKKWSEIEDAISREQDGRRLEA